MEIFLYNITEGKIEDQGENVHTIGIIRQLTYQIEEELAFLT